MANARGLTRRPALIVLPLLCVVAWLHARAVSSWTASLLGTPLPNSSSAPPLATALPPSSTRSGQPILTRNPFDSITGPLVPDVDHATASAATRSDSWPDCPPDIRVVAIAAADPGTSLAVLRSTGAGATPASSLRRVGGSVGSHRIVHIARDRVFLQGDQGPCQLRLADPSDAGATAHGPPDPQPVRPSRGIRQVGDGEFEVDRSELERVLTNPGSVVHARAAPESVDGRPVGLRLLGVRQDDPLAALGLRNGDRLESINGYDLTDPEAMLIAYARLRTADSFSLRLNRGGTPLGIEVKIR
jgi:general secretion pathway protein C